MSIASTGFIVRSFTVLSFTMIGISEVIILHGIRTIMVLDMDGITAGDMTHGTTADLDIPIIVDIILLFQWDYMDTGDMADITTATGMDTTTVTMVPEAVSTTLTRLHVVAIPT